MVKIRPQGCSKSITRRVQLGLRTWAVEVLETASAHRREPYSAAPGCESSQGHRIAQASNGGPVKGRCGAPTVRIVGTSSDVRVLQ